MAASPPGALQDGLSDQLEFPSSVAQEIYPLKRARPSRHEPSGTGHLGLGPAARVSGACECPACHPHARRGEAGHAASEEVAGAIAKIAWARIVHLPNG